MLSEETLKSLVEFIKIQNSSVMDFTTDLLNQIINFYIFTSIINILLWASILLVVKFICMLLDRSLGAMKLLLPEDDKDYLLAKNNYKLLKTIIIVIGFGVFIGGSHHRIINLGKVFIAPKLFMIESGMDLINKYKQPNSK